MVWAQQEEDKRSHLQSWEIFLLTRRRALAAMAGLPSDSPAAATSACAAAVLLVAVPPSCSSSAEKGDLTGRGLDECKEYNADPLLTERIAVPLPGVTGTDASAQRTA